MEPERPDLAELVKEFQRQAGDAGRQMWRVMEELGDEAQFQLDKEFAKALAKHPELYAELKRSVRQAKRTLDAAADALGLK